MFDWLESDSVVEDDIGMLWHVLLSAHYFLVSVVLIRFYRFVVNADGISYISLAQNYLSGHFSQAISGHWAPLISWAVLPLLKLKIDPPLAFKITSIFIGLAGLFGVDLLLRRLCVPRNVRILYLLALGPVMAWYAQNFIGADLLCAVALIFYLNALLKPDYSERGTAGLSLGVLGAVAYLAKNYNFYFFILHFSCINVCYWWLAQDGRRRCNVAINFLVGMLVFALISGVWVGLISNKYHRFTVGTAGAYNISLVHPGSAGHPVQMDGFFAPPNQSAVSVWEDPTLIPLKLWSPARSGWDFFFYVTLVLHNVFKYVSGLATNYLFDLTFAFFAYKVFFKGEKIVAGISYVWLTILLYPLGYFALYYDGQRYVLINAVLLYVLSACAVAAFLEKGGRARLKYPVFAFVYLSIIALTSYRVYKDYQPIIVRMDRIHDFAEEFAKEHGAGDKTVASENTAWNYSLATAYYLGCHYVGEARHGMRDTELERQLLANHVDYYLVEGDFKRHLAILKPMPRLKSQPEDLTVYRVKAGG